jgi:hypothetical protein
MADPGRWPITGSLADLLQRMQEQGALGNSEARGGHGPLWSSQGSSSGTGYIFAVIVGNYTVLATNLLGEVFHELHIFLTETHISHDLTSVNLREKFKF